MRSDIRARRHFPRLRTARSYGQSAQAQRATGDDPLILTLARGHYCPKEHQQHLELAAFYPKISWRTLRSPRSPPTITIRCRIPCVSRSRVDLPFGPRPNHPEGPRHPGVHRSEHNPMIPHACAQAGPRDFQHLNGYGSGTSIGHRSLARSARRHE